MPERFTGGTKAGLAASWLYMDTIRGENLIRVARFPQILMALVVGALILSGCADLPLANSTEPSPVPCDSEIPWDEAVGLLGSGRVAEIFQTHSLKVTLVLDDGCTVHTVEPVIDDIFHEVEVCGDPCSEIILVTE